MKRKHIAGICAVMSMAIIAGCGSVAESKPVTDSSVEKVSEVSSESIEEEPTDTPAPTDTPTPTPTEAVKEELETSSSSKIAAVSISEKDEEKEEAEGVESDGEGETAIAAQTIDEVQAGSNQKNAAMLSLGSRVKGTIGENGIAWYAFETEEKSGIEYDLTIVNMNNKGTEISCGIYDKKGDQMENAYTYDHGAEWNGYPRTISAKGQTEGTTYYIQVTCDLEKDIQNNTEPEYALLLRSSDHPEEAYSVTDNLGDNDESVVPGTNLVEAAGISVGDDIQESFKTNSIHWYKFRTLPDSGGIYNVTVVNMTVGSPEVGFRILDDYGNEYVQTHDHRAEDNGKAATISSDQLEPDKVYYIEVWDDGTDEPSDNEYDLELSVEGISDSDDGKEEETAFAEPFSLDETQVRFVINEATYYDPDAAKKALEPVAEEILKYPDNKILICGTTATWGSQAYVQDLSDRRAAAVKKTLVEDFDVPEDQLVTIGLGYENDPFERAADRDVSGNFIESEAKKNRRVVILDADSDIAKKILGEDS